MTDLEQELADVLTGAAEDAPGAIGLADAARRRHRVRRQRRLALSGAAAALVVGMGAVVVGGLGGNGRATDPVDDPAPKGWQTISQDDVRAEVPADWEQVSCPDEPGSRWAPPSADPCGAWSGAGFYGSATFDPAMEPGVLLRSDDGAVVGYVYAGDFALSVSTTDRTLVRRILGSARVDGDPVVDARQWVTLDRHGLVYEVPAWWGVGEAADRSEYSVCLVPAETDGRQAYSTGSSYVLTSDSGPAHVVRVVAPTQALAELVLDSVDSSSALAGQDCTPEDFMTALLPGESTPGGGGAPAPALTEAEHDGVVVSVLDDWRQKTCGGSVQFTPGRACRSIQSSEGIQFLDARTFEPAMDEGVLIRGGAGRRLLWAGFARRGEYAVLVVHADKQTAQTLLELIR